MRNPAVAFDTYLKFDTLADRAQHLVLDQGVMPLAKRTYQRFWTGFSASDPSVIDLLGVVPAARRPGNGPPVAFAGVDQSARVGDSIRLDASGSLYADSFFWTRISVPFGSFANVSQPTIAAPTFTPDRPGNYTFEVEAANSRGFDTARVTITATQFVTAGVDFVAEIVPILESRCVTCHKETGGTAPPFDAPLISTRNETLYRNISRVVNAFEPDQSLAILKATNTITHGGGLQLGAQQSAQLNTLMNWIRQGANREPAAAAPTVQTRILTVSAGNGGTVSNPGIGTFGFDHGRTVPITATPNQGWVFDRWTGSAVTNGKVADPGSPTTTVRMDGDYALRANFKQQGGPAWSQVVSIGLSYDVPQHPNPNLSLDFSFDRVVQLNFRADLRVEIAPASNAGGVWSASVTPSTVNPGEVTITISVKGDHINIGAPTPGSQDVQLANVTLFARPAP